MTGLIGVALGARGRQAPQTLSLAYVCKVSLKQTLLITTITSLTRQTGENTSYGFAETNYFFLGNIN